MNNSSTDILVVTNQHYTIAAIGSTVFVRISDSPCNYDKFDSYPRWLRSGQDLFEKRGFSWDGVIYARESDYTAPILDTLIVKVAEWTLKTFSDTKPTHIADRILQESRELKEACSGAYEGHPEQIRYIADEMADVLHCLIDLCAKLNIDMAKALEQKFVTNLNRIWPFHPDENNQKQHIKPSDNKTLEQWGQLFGFNVRDYATLGTRHVGSLKEFATFVEEKSLIPQSEIQWKGVLTKLARPPFVEVQ